MPPHLLFWPLVPSELDLLAAGRIGVNLIKIIEGLLHKSLVLGSLVLVLTLFVILILLLILLHFGGLGGGDRDGDRGGVADRHFACRALQNRSWAFAQHTRGVIWAIFPTYGLRDGAAGWLITGKSLVTSIAANQTNKQTNKPQELNLHGRTKSPPLKQTTTAIQDAQR